MWSKFALHDLIVVIDPINIECCDTTIQKGSPGKIIDVDPDTKDLTVRLSGYYPDLRCRNNCISILASDARRTIKRVGPRNGRVAIYVLGAIALFLAPGDRALNAFIDKAGASRIPPVSFQRYNLLTNQVRAADPNAFLEVHAERLLTRPCIFRWVRDFIRTKDGFIVAEDQSDAHHISPIGKVDNYNFRIKVPDFLDPGDYTLRNAATMDCDGGDVDEYFQDPVRFTVLPPS